LSLPGPDDSGHDTAQEPAGADARSGWSLLPDLGVTARMAAVLQAAWFVFSVGVCITRRSHAGVYLTLWLVGALVLIYILQRLGGRPASPIGRAREVIGADTPQVDRLLHDLMSIGLFLFCLAAVAIPPEWVKQLMGW
jgi:hypothetical protein